MGRCSPGSKPSIAGMLVLVAAGSWQRSLPAIREQGGIASMWVRARSLCRPWHTAANTALNPCSRRGREQPSPHLHPVLAVLSFLQLRESILSAWPELLRWNRRDGLGAPAQQRLARMTGSRCCGPRALAAPADVDQFVPGDLGCWWAPGEPPRQIPDGELEPRRQAAGHFGRTFAHDRPKISLAGSTPRTLRQHAR